MTKKILCAVDGSEASKHAVTEASQMAKAMGAELVLLAVDQVIFEGRSAPVHKLGAEDVKKILDAAQATAHAAGAMKVAVVGVASRDVGRAILNYAEDHGVDHIVVGTGEKSAGTRLVVGSVSHDLVVRAHCSVTVAR
jgi:nucleotide-binding universal stress UspA family protein